MSGISSELYRTTARVRYRKGNNSFLWHLSMTGARLQAPFIAVWCWRAPSNGSQSTRHCIIISNLKCKSGDRLSRLYSEDELVCNHLLVVLAVDNGYTEFSITPLNRSFTSILPTTFLANWYYKHWLFVLEDCIPLILKETYIPTVGFHLRYSLRFEWSWKHSSRKVWKFISFAKWFEFNQSCRTCSHCISKSSRNRALKT